MGLIDTVTIGTDTESVYALTLAAAVADGDSFWAVRLGAAATAWGAATADQKAAALIMASDWIDRAVVFSGSKTVSTQPRAWPRDGATCDGTAVTDGTVPDELAWATFWLAGQILVDNEATSSAGTGSNVKSAKAGSAKVEFFSATDGNRLPLTAHDYVGCFLESGNTIITPGISGTGNSSAFDCDDFERSEGYS
jgi:hypothetical protein